MLRRTDIFVDPESLDIFRQIRSPPMNAKQESSNIMRPLYVIITELKAKGYKLTSVAVAIRAPSSFNCFSDLTHIFLVNFRFLKAG